ncbi:MAG: PAS domain S-box protein [Phycisphaerae bacterium]
MKRSVEVVSWATIVLAAMFIVATAWLMTSVNRELRRVRSHVGQLRSLDGLEATLAAMEDTVIRHVRQNQSSQLDRAWPPLQHTYRELVASLDEFGSTGPELKPPIAAMERAVQQMDAIRLDMMAAVSAVGLTEAAWTDLRVARQRGVDAVHAAIKLVRKRQATISVDLAGKWRHLTILAIVSCLLAILAAVLLRRHHHALQGLRRLEARLDRQALVFRNLHDAVILTDAEGRITDWNPAAERTFGFTKDEVIGKSPELLNPPAVAAGISTTIRLAVSRDGRWSGEIPFVRKDGTEGVCDATLVPLRNERGDWIGTVSANRDVTERKQAEQALRESEAKFRILAETMSAAMFVFQGDRLLYVNPAAETVTGYSREDFQQMKFWDVIHPDSVDLVRERGLARQRGEAVPERYEVKIRTKRGEERWVDFTAGMIEYEGTSAVLGTAFDITERRQAEEALRLTQFAIDHASEAAFWVRPDGRFFYVNEAACRWLGYSREELLRMGVPDIDPRYQPDRLAELFCRLRDETTAIVETRVRAKGGRMFPAEITLARFEFEGQEYACALMRDITERKQAEDRLRKSEERLQLALGALDGGIWDWNVATGEVYFSARWAEMLGYEPDEIKPHLSTWEDALHPDDKPEVVRILNDYFEGRRPNYRSEHRMRTKSGAWIWVLDRGNVVRWSEDGRPLRMTGADVDISARKRAEEERSMLEAKLRLAQKMEAVGTLASGVAHGFSNLLTAIFGYTALAKTTLEQGHRAVRSLEMVEQAARQAQGVTDSLLTFAHGAASEKTRLDFRRLVRRQIRLIRGMLPESVRIVESLDGKDPLWVLGNETQLQQMLTNIAVNGGDAMPDGGALHIRLQSEPASEAPDGTVGEGIATLVVEDTGTGMSAETAARIFDPFFSTKPAGRGTGLGLSIVHSIVEDHQGTIEIQSAGNQGTRVSVVLPCTGGPAVSGVDSDAVPEPPGRDERILTVGWESYIASIMTSALRAQGYEVVRGGNEGIERSVGTAGSADVRLAIVNLDAPEPPCDGSPDGWREAAGDAPVIFVTNRPAPELENVRTSSDLLLHKPFQMTDLMAMVRDVLARALAEEDSA